MIFDCDYYNTPIASGYQDTEGSLTSPVLNFEAIGSVIVNWESYFRYCCYPYAPVFLEVGYTVDGVTFGRPLTATVASSSRPTRLRRTRFLWALT